MPHRNKIKDTETHFIIDPTTRAITNSSAANNIIVQYDHNSERFTFEMPRYVDGHDMSESSEVRVHYVNSASTKLGMTSGVYICEDLAISSEDENKVTFSWLLSSATTQYIGFLHFSIQFICLEGESIEYAWNTGIYKDIVIIESINNAEETVTDNIDAINALKREIITEIKVGTNGNWWVGETDTGVKAQGAKGENGLTPYIGDNGNWWIGETDTGVIALSLAGGATVVQTPGNSETAVMSQKAVTEELNLIKQGGVNDRSLTAEKQAWLDEIQDGTREEVTELFMGLVDGIVEGTGIVNTAAKYKRTDYIDISNADIVRVRVYSYTPTPEATSQSLYIARFDKDKNFISGSRMAFNMYALTEDGGFKSATEATVTSTLNKINTAPAYAHGLGNDISVSDYSDGTVYIILFNLKNGDVIDMSVAGVTIADNFRYVLPEDMMTPAIVEDIENLKDAVEDIKNSVKPLTENNIVLSDYAEPLIDKIALAAKAHMKEDSLCFVLFADTHYTANNTCFPTLIAKKLAQATNASAIVHLGDLAHLYEEDRAVGLEIFQRHSKILQDTKIPYLQVVGNHDDGQMYLHNFTHDYAAENYIKPYEMYHATTKQSRQFIKLGSVNGWYYMDDEDSKTRLIVLNAHNYPWVVNEDGTLAYDSNARESISAIFSTEQIEWLANTALNFADKGDVTEQAKWSVLAFAHMGTTNWAPINYLLTAFWKGQKLTDFSNCGADAFGLYDYDSITITNDFSLVGGRKVAYLLGDIHQDTVSGGNYPLITFLDCKLKVVDLGTPNEAAISVLVATPSEGKITELRFGEGTKTVDGETVAHNPLTDYDNYRIIEY